MSEPTLQERYDYFKRNAEAFVQSMSTMVAAFQRDGDAETASRLKVWCLMPWQAALRDDASGDLWPVCEACLKPIKDEADRVSGDACDFHRACVSFDEHASGK